MEIEAKFRARDAAGEAEPLLIGLLHDEVELQAIERRDIGDVYLDTVDRSLLRSGWTLRIRTRRDRPDLPRMLTLKSLLRNDDQPKSPIHSRSEINAALASGATPGDLHTLPVEVKRWLEDVISGVPRFEDLLRIDQIRVAGKVVPLPTRSSAPGDPVDRSPIGELSVDDATVVSTDGRPIASFREIEFERLDPADSSEFERLVGIVAQHKDLDASTIGKVETGLELVARHASGTPSGELDIRPDSTMLEAGRMIWARQLHVMLLTEAGARRGDDIEYVHDMRVSTRRARAAWKVYGGYYDKEAVRPLLKGLRKTARRLGGVRDLDVALEALSEHSREHTSETRQGLDALADSWRSERELSYEALYSWLDGKTYRRFIRGMVRHCSTPGANVLAGRAADRIGDILPGVIRTHHQVVLAYHDRIGSAAEEPIETLHDLRIECKRLRYAIEPVRHLMGAPGKGVIKRLKRLQDVLGDLNDADVARGRLNIAIGSGHDSTAVIEYLEKQLESIKARRQDFESVWIPFTSKETNEALEEAISRL